jgi:hypothetical protein
VTHAVDAAHEALLHAVVVTRIGPLYLNSAFQALIGLLYAISVPSG